MMEWAMRKKCLSKTMVGAVMSQYDGAKTRKKVESAYSEEFKVKVDVYQGSVLLLLPDLFQKVSGAKSRSWTVQNEMRGVLG